MSDTSDSSSIYQTHRIFSPGRIWAIARTTLTQLVRMKVFYFLLIFAVLVIAASFVFLRYSFEQELKLLKDVSFGAMGLFSSIFAIAGTAILIPKDVEDRTLYTILSKPVPRLEYLMGKLLGVLLLIAISLGIMTILFFAVLYFRQNLIFDEQMQEQLAYYKGDVPAGELESIKEMITAQGVSWYLLIGVLAIFLKASVAAAMALLISTVASSTLFTILVSLVIYFIGHVQSMAREFWFQQGAIPDSIEKIISVVVSLAFPDFQMFNIVDGIVSGEAISSSLILQLSGLALFYVIIYNIVAYLIFSNKEL
jgi:ABC-type Na+ efflux pump permease subunit